MKTRPFLLLSTIIGVSIFLLFFISENSFAQRDQGNTPSEQPTLIFVETYVRDSDGKLITYLTSSKFTFVDLNGLEELLDNEVSETDPIFEKNNQNFQLIRRQQVINYDSENVIASTLLTRDNELGQPQMVVRFAHDGYPIMPGEQVMSIWTFIRPL